MVLWKLLPKGLHIPSFLGGSDNGGYQKHRRLPCCLPQALIRFTDFGGKLPPGEQGFCAALLVSSSAKHTRILEEASGVLDDLKQVVNISTLSMINKDRMDIVDRCYKEMLWLRSLTSYYTNKNISVSYLRAKKKVDTQRVVTFTVTARRNTGSI